MLAGAKEVEFATLLDRLGLSKSALSKQLAHLVAVGYVAQDHRARAGRNRQWLSLTPAGRRAYRGHVRALHDLLEERAGEPIQ